MTSQPNLHEIKEVTRPMQSDYEDLDDPEGLITYLYDRDEPEFARQIAWGLWRSGKDNEDIRQKWEKV